jgi:hypothetical protein
MTSLDRPSSQAETAQTPIEVWFRRTLILFSLMAGMVLVFRFGTIFWAQNEFTQPESIVGAQSMMLANDGTLYYGLNSFPHTIAAYTPIFYCLEAGLYKIGLRTVLAGRLISSLAMLGLVFLTWRLTMLYTRDRYSAWTAAVLCASTSMVTSWGPVGQVDTLAIFWAVAGFYQFSRYYVKRENTLVPAGAFVILAFFTKQTMIASPAAMFLLLWFESRTTAIRFAAGVGAVIATAALAINAVSSGRFLADTVFANMNPFTLSRGLDQAQLVLMGAGQLILVVIAGAARMWRGNGRALLVYFGMTSTLFAATASKIGADSNYQIEPTVVLIVCASVALSSLKFFDLCFLGSKSWITLLQIPLLVHLVLNYRITVPSAVGGVGKELSLRPQIAALEPYFADGGRVVSTDVNAMVRLKGRIEVEPLIYTLLVAGGAVDPEPLRRQIAAEAFSTIILFEDVGDATRRLDPEIPSLPASQLQEIQKHYKLVERIPGPYQNGDYVYRPAGGVVR